MIIKLTDEQFCELVQEARDANYRMLCGSLQIVHERSGIDIYAEMLIDDDKAEVNYIEANRGTRRFWCDKETVDRFQEWGNRTPLTDEHNSCPNCYTHMIYRFNYCPKCGQVLRWE